MKRALPFGLSPRAVLLSATVVLLFFGGTLWALNRFSPKSAMTEGRPKLKELAPLQPVTKTSQIVAPVAVAALAIRDVLEANAPRGLNGTRDNPMTDLLGKAEIGWTASRGPIQVVGAPPGLNISTIVSGSLRLTGQIATQGGNLTGQTTGLLGNKLGGEVQKLTTRMLDQRADIRGNVTIVARPALLPNWRIEPNLTAQVAVADGGMQVGGVKLNVMNEVKPMLDNAVNEQMGALSNSLRNDSRLEVAVRKEWVKLCRSIPLGQAAPSAPALWLEVRPIKAFAAQPRIVPDWVILTVGVAAETRIVPSETKPDCPFPAQLDIVPQLEQGNVAVTVPIDVPFTELNRVMEAQLKGKTFPDDGKSPGEVTVLGAEVTASGDRLLISLRVKARETKSWFGFGAEATVHIWGKPALDPGSQIMRLTDISLDVESEAAFGLLGAAARAAIPYLQSALAKNAVVDLKPFAANAQTSIETALKEFSKPVDGVEVEAGITGLRLVGIEFDSKTLRVTGEAQGTARALVRKLACKGVCCFVPCHTAARLPVHMTGALGPDMGEVAAAR